MFEIIQGPVLELAESLQGALLYLDAGAGEIAQTTLGLPFLLGLGVTHVCSLETASPEDSAFPVLATGLAPARLTIFTTQLLTDAHRDLLRAVLAHPAVSSVAIFCSVSEHAHACQAATDLGVEAYREYAEMLRTEVRRSRAAQQPSQQAPSAAGAATGAAAASGGTLSGGGGGAGAVAVRVCFLPLLACCLDPGLFVMPAGCSAARRGVTGGLAAGFGPMEPNSGDAASGEGASGGLSLTAHALLALSAALGVSRPEPFPIGPVSSAIAAELASLPSVAVTASSAAAGASSTSASPSLALILVDRSLDLAAPCSHTDHPWDIIVAATAARQAAAAVAGFGRRVYGSGGGSGLQAVWRPLDLRAALPGADAIPLEMPWIPSPPHDDGGASHLSYGQLSYDTYGVEILDPTDKSAISRVEAVAGRPRRDALTALRRGLKEALRAEKLTPAVRSKAGVVQAPELRGLSEPLVAAPGGCSRQRGVAALGLAVADAMTGPAAAEWEAAAGLGRSVLAALAGGGGAGGGGCESAVQVLLDALDSAQQGRGLLHVGHVLEVLPAVFSAAADSEGAGAAASSSPSTPPPRAANSSAGCPFSQQQQAALRAALAQAVLGCARVQEALAGRMPPDLVAALAARQRRRQGVQGACGDEAATPASSEESAVQQRLSAVIDAFFSALRYASVSRERLKTFRKVTHMDVFAENHGALSPLLRQVVRKVLQRAELPDWQQQAASGGGGGLVRGLLGGLMGASRALVGRAGGQQGPQQLPGDCATVMVFVVGGISAAEVREVRSELDEHVGTGKPRFLLGGTSLLLPLDVTLQLAVGPQP